MVCGKDCKRFGVLVCAQDGGTTQRVSAHEGGCVRRRCAHGGECWLRTKVRGWNGRKDVSC